MGYEMRAIAVVVSIVVGLTSAAYALKSQAKYFDPPYIPSTCYGNQDVGPMVALVGPALRNRRAACRNSYRVKCTGGGNAARRPCKNGATVVVEVVGLCPSSCNSSSIALSRAAFLKIADLQAGVIFIEYDKV